MLGLYKMLSTGEKANIIRHGLWHLETEGGRPVYWQLSGLLQLHVPANLDSQSPGGTW